MDQLLIQPPTGESGGRLGGKKCIAIRRYPAVISVPVRQCRPDDSACGGVLPSSGAKGKVTAQDQMNTGRDGGAEGNRTPDLLNAIQALSQLSYGPDR